MFLVGVVFVASPIWNFSWRFLFTIREANFLFGVCVVNVEVGNAMAHVGGRRWRVLSLSAADLALDKAVAELSASALPSQVCSVGAPLRRRSNERRNPPEGGASIKSGQGSYAHDLGCGALAGTAASTFGGGQLSCIVGGGRGGAFFPAALASATALS